MKYYNKSILLIACMLIFLLIGAVSANKNDTISNVGTDNNTLVGSVNQSVDLGSQQNNNNDVVDYSDNLSSKINIGTEFSNSPDNKGSSFSNLDNLLNFTNNTLYSGYDIININSSYNFKQVISNITNFENGSRKVILNLTSNYYCLDANQDIVFNFNSGDLIINGNNATITTSKGDIFLYIGAGATAQIFNCTFTNCKPPIRSYGKCTVVNCLFKNNKRHSTVNAHGLIRKGGAIDSYGTLYCINCSFFDNLGSYGGAVCCESNSQAVFTNCKWNKNTAGSIFNSDVVQNCGEDIFVHNSAFAQIFYNSSSEKPQIGTMQSGAVQMINSSENNISNNIVLMLIIW